MAVYRVKKNTAAYRAYRYRKVRRFLQSFRLPVFQNCKQKFRVALPFRSTPAVITHLPRLRIAEIVLSQIDTSARPPRFDSINIICILCSIIIYYTSHPPPVPTIPESPRPLTQLTFYLRQTTPAVSRIFVSHKNVL